MRKIAIVGSSASSASLAPFGDATWEIWGLAWHVLPRADRLFEVHNPAIWHAYAGDNYLRRLQTSAAQIVLVKPHPEIPGALIYPVEQVQARCALPDRPADIFTSSISYMMGLALLQCPDEIGLFGVDMMADDEYAYQRPAAEYLIGLAVGAGIKITIPSQSALCRANFVYGDLASIEPFPKATGLTEDVLQARIDHYARDRAATQQRIHTDQARLLVLEGHITESQGLQELVRHFNRGGVIPVIPGTASQS
jgi:hypothetical protein